MTQPLGPAQWALREILTARLNELDPWTVDDPPDRCPEVAHPSLAPILDEADGAVLDHAVRAATQKPRTRLWDAEFRCIWDSAAFGQRYYIPIVVDPRPLLRIGGIS
ncbi:hypothetical protein ACIBG0_38885 [Nocardia sp. NPDC050630]|uniref:hypothetical protein n=1 Tax=Nocardia sp. NPDC050630 TaxID=3364321 RepID=UPI0037AA6F62